MHHGRRDRAQRRDLRSRAARRPDPARRRLAARQAPRRHAQGSDARRNQPHQEAFGRQKGGGTARHGARSAPLFVGGAKAMGPVNAQPRIRAAQEGARARPAPCAFGQGEGRRDHRDRRSQAGARSRPRTWRSSSASWACKDALIVDGEFDKNFALSARNLGHVSLLPAAGLNVYDILSATSWC